MSSYGLEPSESVPLLTAWVSRLAVDTGIRALIIKGPLMAVQGLRPTRESGDVDLWVDPAQVDRYFALLESHGWAGVVNDRPSILPPHARTLRHESWACELDLHDRFPGFFADRFEVFERLWELRTVASLAAVPVTTLARSGNAVVLALHLLRDLRAGRPANEFRFLVDSVSGFTPAERRTMTELVAACGANETMAPFLEAGDLVPLPSRAASIRDLDDWHLLTQTHGAPTVYWLHRLSRTPWRRRPALLWRAFWLSDVQIRDEAGAEVTAWAMLRARLRRLRRGLRTLPRAVRLVLSNRNG